MDNEEIIRMAREAGAMFDHMTWVERDLAPVFKRFAALVAAHEREKAKAVFEELEREVKAEIINAINGAVELEREACAKVCEEVMKQGEDFGYECAAAIRARDEK